MSQLIKLLKNAGKASSRPSAGFGARSQEPPRKKLVLIAALSAPDVAEARKAVEDGADAIEFPYDPGAPAAGEAIVELTEAVSVPVGAAISGTVSKGFDVKALEGKGLDYLKVEAGDVPATVFLAEGVTVVLELKETFADTMLKMLNFLPAKAVQVDSPDTVEGFTVKQLMEKRVDRELISKPLLMKVGSTIKPDAAQLLTLISPNALVVAAADVAAWNEAITNIKDLDEEEEETGTISLRAPVAAAASK